MKKGWELKKLGDVCKTGSGGTPLSSRKEYYEGGAIPWLLSGEVSQGEIRIATKFITSLGLENSAARLFPKDTVLIAMYGATAGQVGILRFEAATNQAVCGILPNKQFIPEFLFYYFLAMKDDLVAQAAGNAQPNISQVKIRNTEVPVPPLAEQQRIVGVLDEAFAGLATAQAHAEKNLQNARALFESHLQSVFTQRGEGWFEKSLGECFKLKSGDGLTSKAMRPGIYPVFGGNGIAGMHDEFNLSGDSVIVGRVGALCGNARHVTEKFWLTDNAFRIADPSFEFEGAFLTYLLNFKNLRSLARQAAQPVISNSSLKDLVLNFPGIVEQRRIAEQLDALSAETQRLESLYQQKLAALAALKKSLLHQAFSSEL